MSKTVEAAPGKKRRGPKRMQWHMPPGQRDSWPIQPPPRKDKAKDASK